MHQGMYGVSEDEFWIVMGVTTGSMVNACVMYKLNWMNSSVANVCVCLMYIMFMHILVYVVCVILFVAT